MQPINRLPPETLSYIIRYIPKKSAKDASSIIPMTHVCRYWRESIISTPENWTRISSQRIGLAKLSLERCKAAPIELWLNLLRGEITPEFSQLIKSHIQNAKVLAVGHDLTKDEFVRSIPNLLMSTPNLRSLSLFGGRVGAALWDWFDDPCSQLISPLEHLCLVIIPLYPSFLRLKTLTDFTLHHPQFNLHLDTLLDFLEENHSLEHALLDIEFTQPSLRDSRRRLPIKSRLRRLSISSSCAVDIEALLSKIAVRKGASLEINLWGHAGTKFVCSAISTAHVSNLRSPTFMEYCPNEGGVRTIRLLGPDGSFSLKRKVGIEAPFYELPIRPRDDIRTVHLIHSAPASGPLRSIPIEFHPSSFPVLETLAIERERAVSYFLSALFSNPSTFPSLKTLAFLDCKLDGGFMEELTRFSSNRRCTSSAWLHRIVIVNSTGKLPPFALIDELGKHVPVVDVRVGKELPSDVKWNDLGGC